MGDILIDLEYADRFDEDIKYMLECELYDDAEDDKYNEANSKKLFKAELRRGKGEDVSIIPSEITESLIVPELEFDDLGRDWRDITRGGNNEFNDLFLAKLKEFEALPNKSDSDDFCVMGRIVPGT